MRPTNPSPDHSRPAAQTGPKVDADVSRSGFLRGGALAVGAGTLGAAMATGTAAHAAPTGGRDRPGRGGGRGIDPNPDYRPPQVTRLATVTGPGITTRFRMDATDLGAPAVTPDGRILVIFGDTFEEPAVGGGWWRSPVGLFAEPRRRLGHGLEWTSAVGGETAE